MKKTISVVLIVFNEERNMDTCLENLIWADEIVVVDGGSTDRTVEIASRYTKAIYQRSFDDFGSQKNFAIQKATGDWILSIDADERVDDELKKGILHVIQYDDMDGYSLKRRNLIFGQELIYGGQGPEKILRLFKKDSGFFDQPIHERLVIKGKVGRLPGNLLHNSIPSIKEYRQKLDLYTDFEAKFIASSGRKAGFHDIHIVPFLRFFYFYIVLLGFLDGWAGLQFQFLSAYYYHLKYKKLKQKQAKERKRSVKPKSRKKDDHLTKTENV